MTRGSELGARGLDGQHADRSRAHIPRAISYLLDNASSSHRFSAARLRPGCQVATRWGLPGHWGVGRGCGVGRGLDLQRTLGLNSRSTNLVVSWVEGFPLLFGSWGSSVCLPVPSYVKGLGSPQSSPPCFFGFLLPYAPRPFQSLRLRVQGDNNHFNWFCTLNAIYSNLLVFCVFKHYTCAGARTLRSLEEVSVFDSLMCWIRCEADDPW